MLHLPALAIVAGLTAVIATIMLSTKNPGLFLNLPGLTIIIGGVLTSLFVSYSKSDIQSAINAVKLLFNDTPIDKPKTIKTLTHIAYLWARHDLREIEKQLSTLDNHFVKTGIQKIIDGHHSADIAATLNWKIEQLRNTEYGAAKMFHSLAMFAPAFGMVGTLLGLVNMMFLINEQASTSIANHLAVALVTTFYGLVFANLFFKPVAIKLERRADLLVEWMRVVGEGIMMIEKRKSPGFIQQTMDTLAPTHKSNPNRSLLSREVELLLNN
ncbi:motility protein A [Alkalimarinus coralli]|uniref:motility protein A n=1 Tax=Alkalimarinus coralli TaxID=2935863 RepID=UPI00202B1309|nr:MotA/TolQ/ExbB proton channel family protein [Alkalimarinus coralli]